MKICETLPCNTIESVLNKKASALSWVVLYLWMFNIGGVLVLNYNLPGGTTPAHAVMPALLSLALFMWGLAGLFMALPGGGKGTLEKPRGAVLVEASYITAIIMGVAACIISWGAAHLGTASSPNSYLVWFGVLWLVWSSAWGVRLLERITIEPYTLSCVLSKPAGNNNAAF